MKCLKDEPDLRYYLKSKLLVEVSHHFQQFMQRQSFDRFQNYVQFLLILKSRDQFIDPIDLSFRKMPQRFFLILDMLDTNTILERLFLDSLHRRLTTLQIINSS